MRTILKSLLKLDWSLMLKKTSASGWFLLALSVLFLMVSNPAWAKAKEVGHPTFMSPHSAPIALNGDKVYVVNTPADTVDVIDTFSYAVVARIKVGIDPVSIAVRPDGLGVWVSNHVSDSLSVIDTDPANLTYHQVIATVQDFSPTTKATRFDEPVGIAFASNAKAYVALSSENQIAVIDVATRQVVKHLAITAQDPRAIVVRGDRLYVIAFESNNQTQISGCVEKIDGNLCTFDATKLCCRQQQCFVAKHRCGYRQEPEHSGSGPVCASARWRIAWVV